MILNEVHIIEKIYIITAFLTGVGSLFLGFFVYFKNKRKDLNQAYFLMSVTIGIWSFLLSIYHITLNINTALFLNRCLHIAAVFIPPTFLHFILVLLGQFKKKEAILRIGYFYSVTLLGFVFTPFFIKTIQPKFYFRIWPVPGPVYPFFLLLFFIFFVYIWFLVFKAYKDSSDSRKNQLKYIFIGLTVGFLGGSTNYPYFYNIPVIPIGNFFVFFYVVLYAYAIVKHRLMDIQLVIARSVILLCVYAGALAVVAVLWYPLRPVLQALLGERWYLAPLSIFAGLLFVAPFVYIHYQQKYDQRRLRRQRAQLRRLREVATAAIEMKHEQLLKTVTSVLMDMYRSDFGTSIEYAAAYYYNASEDAYSLFSLEAEKAKEAGIDQKVLKTDPIPAWFFNKAPELIKKGQLEHRYLESIKYEDIDYYQSSQADAELVHNLEALKTSLKNFKADVCVYCYFNDRLLAFLLLGKKQEGSYSTEELDTFNLLAHDIAAAIRGEELRGSIEQSYVDVMHSIIKALEERDPYSRGHSARVVQYSMVIGEELSRVSPFSRIFDFRQKLQRAALLHDVGKIGLPDKLHVRHGRFSEEESMRFRRHPQVSLNIIKDIRSVSKEVKDGIASHHERYDGSGYPRSLRASAIPPLARIIAVADAYDSIICGGQDRKALSEEEAREEINKYNGKRFDPAVVDAFNKAYRKSNLKKAP